MYSVIMQVTHQVQHYIFGIGNGPHRIPLRYGIDSYTIYNSDVSIKPPYEFIKAFDKVKKYFKNSLLPTYSF